MVDLKTSMLQVENLVKPLPLCLGTVRAFNEIFFSINRQETRRKLFWTKIGDKFFKHILLDLNLFCHAPITTDLTFQNRGDILQCASIFKQYPCQLSGKAQQHILNVAAIPWQPLSRKAPENFQSSCQQHGFFPR